MEKPREQNLYADKNGYLVELLEDKDGQVKFAPQGGGMVKSGPSAKFHELFKPAELPGVWRKVLVSGDWMPDDQWVEAYSTGERWNGWAVPYFTLETAMRLKEHLPGLRYDEKEDAFINVDDTVEPEASEERFECQPIVVGDETIKAYPVGAGSWCWYQKD